MEIYFIQHSEIHPGCIICKASRVNPQCCKDAVERLPSREGTEWNHALCLSPMLFLIHHFFSYIFSWWSSYMMFSCDYFCLLVFVFCHCFSMKMFFPCSAAVLPSMLCIPFKLELRLMSPSPFVLRSEHISKIVISVCGMYVGVFGLIGLRGSTLMRTITPTLQRFTDDVTLKSLRSV